MTMMTKEQAQLALEEMTLDPKAMAALTDKGHHGHAHHLRRYQALTKIMAFHDGLREPTSEKDMRDSELQQQYEALSAAERAALPEVALANFAEAFGGTLPAAAPAVARGPGGALLQPNEGA